MSSLMSRLFPSPPSLLHRCSLTSCCLLHLALLQLRPWSLHPRMLTSRDLHRFFYNSSPWTTLPSLCAVLSFAWHHCLRHLCPDWVGLGPAATSLSLRSSCPYPDQTGWVWARQRRHCLFAPAAPTRPGGSVLGVALPPRHLCRFRRTTAMPWLTLNGVRP
jgi:hypothetical protein